MALHVRDLQARVRFYGELLGLAQIPSAAPTRCWMRLGPGLQLYLLGGRSQPLLDDRYVHVALQSNALDELICRLDARGLRWGNFAGEARAISTSRTDGVRQIFFQDPDGYWLEVNDAAAARR